ncbi:hypothetical protein [Tenacibaculum agarivorans]|uniref:hypothetical protein n=1 Tax=Tenacibaculum agarivorans TaxID=1908389 RepID=UPI00094BADFE|nr:hypothetical protein [Tenacibaculum agarivorans]
MSCYFKIEISDTLNLGKNIGKIDYNSNFKPNESILYILIENEYSETEKKIDTFIEESNYSRFGFFAHKKGNKRIKGRIIEQLIFERIINKDSTELKIEEHNKYFEIDVIVK